MFPGEYTEAEWLGTRPGDLWVLPDETTIDFFAWFGSLTGYVAAARSGAEHELEYYTDPAPWAYYPRWVCGNGSWYADEDPGYDIERAIKNIGRMAEAYARLTKIPGTF